MLYSPAFRFPARKPTGTKLALKPFHVWGIRVRLQVGLRSLDLALFDLALDSNYAAVTSFNSRSRIWCLQAV